MPGAPGSGSRGDAGDHAPPACLVAIDTRIGPWLCTVPLVPGMRAGDALAAARAVAERLPVPARAPGRAPGTASKDAPGDAPGDPPGDAPGPDWAEALSAVDWGSDRVGLWGQRCTRERMLSAGDRVELYLPLPGDPRERRRARAGASRGPLRRPAR